MASKNLWIGNDNLVRLLNLSDQSGGDDVAAAAVTTATVTAVLKDKNGATVTTITLSFQSGSNGDYEGVIPDTTSLTEGDPYSIEITADDGADRLMKRTISNVIAKVRN